jgi:hypothetical protein
MELNHNTFIGAWFIEDMSLCNDLIFYFENNHKQHPGKISVNGVPSVVHSQKKSIDISLDMTETITKRYLAELQKISDLYVQRYPRSASTSWWNVEENINIQKYEPGGGYFSWHSERTGNDDWTIYRHLVFMTYLNDINDAGETEFEHQQLKIKPKKGLTVVWPADWTHFHRGIPSPTETKYIATGWFSFIRNNNV